MKKKQVIKPTDEATIALALAQQYKAAQDNLRIGVASAVKFGAMLIKAEEIVLAELDGLKHRGRGEKGYGLQAWLAENCPEINYKTAMRWKGIAEGLLPQLGCDRENALLILAGRAKECSPELQVDYIEDRIDELYDEAGSLRKLSQMCFAFADEEKKAGRPKAEQKELPKLRPEEEARAIWTAALLPISKTSVKRSIALLPEADARVVYETLNDLVKALKKHIEEFD